MTLILLYAAAFVAVLIAAETLLRGMASSRARSTAINRRLEKLEKNSDHQKAYNEILLERGSTLSDSKLVQTLSSWYVQSGIVLAKRQMVLYGAGLLVASWLASNFLMSGLAARIVFIALCLILVPAIVIGVARTRRMRAFSNMLPEALDVANRSLSAGHPLNAAVSLVAREMSDPIGSEFGLLSDELAYGLTLDTALENMRKRVGVEDLDLLGIALSVQAGTGGNLVEILQNLSKTLRARSMLRARIKAISAEGRMTAVFMSVYPFLLYLMLKTITPTYFDPFWASPNANAILIAAGIIMLLGNYILYKLVNFDF